MKDKSQVIADLDFKDSQGIAVYSEARFDLNFFAEADSLPFSALIEVETKEEFYLVKALAESKNLDGFENPGDDWVSFNIPAHGLCFIFRF